MRGWILILALTTACVPREVRRGDGFALAEDWESAAAAYREAAVKRPGSSKIAAKVAMAERGKAEARRAKGEEARQRAEAALMEGNYERVLAELSTARMLDPDSASVKALMETASTEVRRLAEERARADGWAPAYPLAVLALRLNSGEAQATALVTRARSGVISNLDDAIAAGAFDKASRLAALVTSWEPGVGDALKVRVREAWSASLVADAAEYEKKRPGEAWLVYARAASLHPSEAAVAGRERMGRAAVEAERVSLSMEPPPEALAADLATLVRTRLGDAGLRMVEDDAELELSHMTAEWSCAETVSTHSESKRYVASTRWVDNPDRLAATARAYEVRAEVPEHEAKVAELYSQVESLRYQAEQHRHDWRVVEDAALRLEESASQHEAWVAEAEAGLREAQQDVSDAAGRGEDVGAYESVVDDWRAEVRSRSDAFDTADSAAREARRRADDVEAEAESAERELASAESDYTRSQRELAEAVADVDRADAAVAALPEAIEEPVYADYPYKAYEVRRTCTVEAGARLGPAEGQAPRAFEARKTVTDRHHPAFPAYGVSEDRLSLSRTDAEMVEEALAEIATTLAAQVRAERDAAYARKVASDPGPGRRAALLLLAPGLGDPAWLAAEWAVGPDELLAR